MAWAFFIAAIVEAVHLPRPVLIEAVGTRRAVSLQDDSPLSAGETVGAYGNAPAGEKLDRSRQRCVTLELIK